MVLLPRSLLNFLKDFCKLNTMQFFRVWENICPTPGEFDNNFLPRGRESDKKLPGWSGLARSKKISPRLPGGGGCTQLELTETLFYDTA